MAQGHDLTGSPHRTVRRTVFLRNPIILHLSRKRKTIFRFPAPFFRAAPKKRAGPSARAAFFHQSASSAFFFASSMIFAWYICGTSSYRTNFRRKYPRPWEIERRSIT